MKKYFKNFSKLSKHLIALVGCMAILSSFLVLPIVVGAAGSNANTGLNGMTANMNTAAGQLKGTGSNNIYQMVGNLINIALGVLGVLLVILIVYAGFLWMTARGAADQVKKAKEMILQAVIGLLIIFAAYALSSFIVTSLSSAVTTNN